jgi:serine protease
MPGAFDRSRIFGLEIIGKLPAKAKLVLEAPLALAEIMGKGRKFEVDEKRKTALFALRPSGRHLFDRITLPAKSRNRLQLLVSIPERDRKHRFNIAARQIFEKDEVGRVTWVLAPDVRKKKKAMPA